jgi:CSLREA domain-containing protein
MLSRVMLAAVGLVPTLCAAPPQVLVVNSSDDTYDGRCDESHCSLREAIRAASRTPRPSEIHFDLPGPPYRIEPESPLPALRSHVVLDGGTQDGAACPLPLVHVDGSRIDAEEPVDGLTLLGDGNRVRGLAITNFSGHGVVVRGSENHLGCLFVGIDPTGTPGGNGGHGIAVVGGHSNHIGGAEPEDGNLLSANVGSGIHVEDAINTLRHNNALGLDLLGSPRLPNGDAELPALDPPPAPSPLAPRAVAVLTGILEQRIAAVIEQNERALDDSGLFEEYVRRLEEDPTGAPPPADLSELVAALVRQPDLYASFTQDAAAVLAEERAESAEYLARLGRVFRQALPAFGRNEAVPRDRRDLQSELLATLDPDDYVVSGAPSQIVAVEANPPIAFNPIVWSSLHTYGAADLFTAINDLLDVRTCLGIFGPCYWPTAYDLLPFAVELLWESSTLTQQEMEDIVQEDGYYLFLRVNGQFLYKGPPFGSQGVDPVVAQLQGYSASTVPDDPCPTGKVCLATWVLGRKILANIPQPWTFELEVKKLTELPMPVIKGIDENGNPIIATHQAEPFAHSIRVVQPNPETGFQSWFTAALYPTFQHPRCTDCHGFGNSAGLAAHHGYGNNVAAFEYATSFHLEPSLYVPAAHVMTCQHCHSLPLTDYYGHPFFETEWIAPYQDLDVNWSQKNAAQTCARVKANLPTTQLRHDHFHGDARLFWAIENPVVPSKTLSAAPPNSFTLFLRRVDMWNFLGAPCP